MAPLASVLVTGGTGFLGSAIARAVAEKHPNCVVFLLDAKPPRNTHKVPKKSFFIKVNITSADDVMDAVELVKPEVIIHSAGMVGSLDLRYGRKEAKAIWNVNVTGTKNIIAAAKEQKVKALVYTSSCAAVTDDLDSLFPNMDETWPTNHSSLPYGESKAVAEDIVFEAQSNTFATCCLRPSLVFGPGDYQVLPSIYALIADKATPFVLGSGYRLWDVSYVTNIADAHVLAAENLVSSKTAAGESFFIQNNEPIPMRDFCLAVWAHFGHYPPYTLVIPMWIAVMLGLIADIVARVTGSTFNFSQGNVKEACSVRYANGNKAKRILSYEPRVGMEEAVRLSCQEYAQRIGLSSKASNIDKKDT